MQAEVFKYVFGEPFQTIAVTEDIPEVFGHVPYFRIKDGISLIFTCDLEPSDAVYGLGETMRGINKRGGSYVMYNTDDPNHRDDMPSMYGAHNFIIMDGSLRKAIPDSSPLVFGAFFDTPSRIRFDVDYKESGKLKVFCENKNLTLYLIQAQTVQQVASRFLKMIGQSFLPPLWAFGYGQSRWGYKCEKDFRTVADRYRKMDIPLDYICMDIDYMDRFIDFTVDQKRFPDMPAFVSEMKKRGIHLVPIVDAGVKIEPGNETYEQGVAEGHFCTNKEGKLFQAAVWPGMTHFPDFFQEKTRKWFGNRYKLLTDMGFEGFWNDMNEPSIFYSEYSKRKGLVGTAVNFFFPAAEEKLAAKEGNGDYYCFYHQVEGKRTLHHDVHNLFGALMTKASGEGLKDLVEGRYLLFSRSSYIGAHRYGGIWTGDNASKWSHLKRNVCQMPSLNMCGFLYSGADTGGFNGNCSRELLLRWLAFSAFTPLMRNHCMLASLPQECYRYPGAEDFRSIVSFRYYLLPYIYSEFMKAALRQEMYIRPLAFAWPADEKCRLAEDQLLVGESIMIAPVIEKGAKSRKVYLPEAMTMVRYSGKKSKKEAPAKKHGIFTLQPMRAGEHEIPVGLHEIIFFILPDKLVPIAKKPAATAKLDMEDLVLIGKGKEYEQYLDDGRTKDCTLENIRILRKNS